MYPKQVLGRPSQEKYLEHQLYEVESEQPQRRKPTFHRPQVYIQPAEKSHVTVAERNHQSYQETWKQLPANKEPPIQRTQHLQDQAFDESHSRPILLDHELNDDLGDRRELDRQGNKPETVGSFQQAANGVGRPNEQSLFSTANDALSHSRDSFNSNNLTRSLQSVSGGNYRASNYVAVDNQIISNHTVANQQHPFFNAASQLLPSLGEPLLRTSTDVSQSQLSQRRNVKGGHSSGLPQTRTSNKDFSSHNYVDFGSQSGMRSSRDYQNALSNNIAQLGDEGGVYSLHSDQSKSGRHMIDEQIYADGGRGPSNAYSKQLHSQKNYYGYPPLSSSGGNFQVKSQFQPSSNQGFFRSHLPKQRAVLYPENAIYYPVSHKYNLHTIDDIHKIMESPSQDEDTSERGRSDSMDIHGLRYSDRNDILAPQSDLSQQEYYPNRPNGQFSYRNRPSDQDVNIARHGSIIDPFYPGSAQNQFIPPTNYVDYGMGYVAPHYAVDDFDPSTFGSDRYPVGQFIPAYRQDVDGKFSYGKHQ